MAGSILAPFSSKEFWIRRLPEWELLALAIITAAIYGSRLTALPIRGEETRRAEVAREILDTGDWIVPRQQGQPFLSRPPLGSYPIAVIESVMGRGSLVAVRLPSVIATWLTTLLIYGYSRRFLSRLGALAAGLVFATMGMVLQLGRLAETDAIFTLFVAGSLLLWHAGFSRSMVGRWQRTWPWLGGYFLAGLGALTKGPQAPAYFLGACIVYLAWRREWRELFSWRHLAGIATFVATVAAWQVPFLLATNWQSVREIWTADVGLRFEDAGWIRLALHVAIYPLSILICMLPWSPLLFAYFFRCFRVRIKEAQPMVMFLAIALAVAFPTCWLVPGARERYFMPLFPCLAPLVGLVIQRALAADAAGAMRIGWMLYVGGAAAAILFAGVAVAGASWIDGLAIEELAQPGGFAALYLLVAAAIFAAMLWRGSLTALARGYVFVLGLAAFAGLSHVGVVVGSMAKASEEAAPAMADLKQKLPKNVRLISFGLIETLFTYYYGEPIEARQWPPTEADLSGSSGYFCFTWDRDYLPPLPFAWHEIGEVSCDRFKHPGPTKRVIVGQRLEHIAAGGLLRDDLRR